MPIRGFLSGQAFEPEVVRQMSLALESVCGKFGIKLTEDPTTRVVALKIIELAQRRVRDAPTLTEMTLQELKHYLPYAEDRAPRGVPGPSPIPKATETFGNLSTFH